MVAFDGSGNRAISFASVSAARALGKRASRAASSQGSTPSRFNAETSLSVTPFLFFANRGKENIVQLKNGAGKIERVALP